MAVTKTINGTVGRNADLYTYQLYCEEKDINQANNTSKLKVTVRIVTGGTSGVEYAERYQSATHTITINGTNYTFTSGNYSLVGQTTTTLGSVTSNAIQHGTDGTKTVNVSASSPDLAQGGGYGPYSGSASGSVTLTAIPRYTTVTTWTITSKTETSVTLGWKTADNVKAIRYGIGTSSSQYTEVTGLNTNSGSVTISGLTANTGYTFYFMPQRKDSSLWGDGSENTWKSLTGQKTYNYPYVKTAGTSELIIGNQQTITIYNPLGRNITVYMKKDSTSGTQFYSGTTTSKGENVSYSFTPNATTLYNSIPASPSGNAVYYCDYIVNNTSHIVQTVSGTYKIKGNEYPTFSENDWTYSANLTSLTNNHPEVAINNYATVTITINNQATSDYSAQMNKYVAKWGNGQTINITAGSTTGTVTGDGNTLILTVYDKRNLSLETTKAIINVPYVDVNISKATTDRNNGVEAGVKLTASGTFYNAKFGENGIQNTIYSAKYYTSTDGTNWSTAYPSGDALKNAITVNGNNFSITDFEIHANGSSGGFSVGTEYYVKLEIKDANGLLSTATYISRITDGKVARDVYKDDNGGYHEGINGLADSNYTQKVYGKIKADEFVGDLNGNASTATSAGSATTATTASKLGSSNVGSSNRPIYLNGGTATQCNTPESGNWFRGVPVVGGGGVLEVGRYIDFHPTNASTLDYSKRIDAGAGTTARTITIPDESGTIQCKPKNLYNNDTGTTGTVTLSETSANFTYLTLTYYKDESGAGGRIYNAFTISVPNGKLVSLFDIHYANASTHQFVSKIIQISGTSITHKYGMLTNIGTNKTVQACEVQNPIYITRVDGYR